MKARLSVQHEVLSITGQIYFNTVMSVCRDGLRLMSNMEKVTIDLQKLEYCDSSILALFTAWLKKMRVEKKSIVFINLPSFVRDLVRVHGLDSVLSIRMV